jgi:NTP pyrophosphatase (non-canonical NTP hydrolase)
MLDILKERYKVYSDAINEFGLLSQMRMCQEECGELIAAINQFLRGRIGLKDLAEEVADVRIMVEQMEICVKKLRVSDVSVSEIVENKVERLRRMLREEYSDATNFDNA